MRSLTLFCVGVVAALAGSACGQQVKRIDLHDRTIPLKARRLVADAEDSIDIARAGLAASRRELQETREWRRELLDREWPTDAQSILPELRKFAAARVRLAELEVERARENVEHARAKFRLITAKTAIRNDLAVYDLDPLRNRVDRESEQVGALESRILEQRERIAQLGNAWWDAYSTYADEGGSTRVFYVASGTDLVTPDLRESDEQQQENDQEDEPAEQKESGN